ncbi:hypothetical protein EGM51_16360 [Verrucomicrobia bacterium S94]|nr:hypothetical protein EGM51_16360 [Verrucomicrobia bacterium S94]
MKRQLFIITLCLISLSGCSVLNIKQSRESENNDELGEQSGRREFVPPPPLPSEAESAASRIAKRYKALAVTDRIDYGIQINDVVELNGKLYLILNGSTYCNELWEFDGDNSLNKLIGVSDFEAMEAQGQSELKFDTGDEYGNHVRGISSLAVADNKLYFSFSNGRISNRLFQYSFTEGPLVIDGVTKVNHLTTWENYGLVFSAVADNNVEGLFAADENGSLKFLVECNPFYPNFIRDGIPYGRAHTLPVIDGNLCITVHGCPYILKQNGGYKSWDFPERFRVGRWAKIENGVFLVENLYGTFLRIENDCRTIKNEQSLPEYMQVYKISDDLKSIGNTVYFNAKSKSFESKVLYYKNENVFGDVTEAFAENDIEVRDLVASFQGNLIIGKFLKIKGMIRSVLQRFNPETQELEDITFLDKPMEINRNNVTFKYKAHLYFVGSNTEYKNCLWRYDGKNDPELIEFKNVSE